MAEVKESTIFDHNRLSLLLKIKEDLRHTKIKPYKIWRTMSDIFLQHGQYASPKQLQTMFNAVKTIYFKRKRLPFEKAMEWPYYVEMDNLCKHEAEVIVSTHTNAIDLNNSPVIVRPRAKAQKKYKKNKAELALENGETPEVTRYKQQKLNLKVKRIHIRKLHNSINNRMRPRKALAKMHLKSALNELFESGEDFFAVRKDSKNEIYVDIDDVPNIECEPTVENVCEKDPLSDPLQTEPTTHYISHATSEKSHPLKLNKLSSARSSERNNDLLEDSQELQYQVSNSSSRSFSDAYETYIEETPEYDFNDLEREKSDWKVTSIKRMTKLTNEKVEALSELSSALKILNNESTSGELHKTKKKKIYIITSDGVNSSFKAYNVDD